jgi:6-phosphogluconolactonase
MGAELRIFDEGIDIWRAMTERWRILAEEAVSSRDVFNVALSGGRTPVGFYCYLSRQEGLPWRKTEIFQVDERLVPPSDEANNMRLIRTSLLTGMTVLPGGVHGVMTEGAGSAAEAARRYEKDLRDYFGNDAPWPVFDLVVLGIGGDGHTASIFPGASPGEDEGRWVSEAEAPVEPKERVTLTMPVLQAARNVVFLATGRQKTAVLRRVWEQKEKSGLPAGEVRPAGGRLSYFVDRFAGECLKGQP